MTKNSGSSGLEELSLRNYMKELLLGLIFQHWAFDTILNVQNPGLGGNSGVSGNLDGFHSKR